MKNPAAECIVLKTRMCYRLLLKKVLLLGLSIQFSDLSRGGGEWSMNNIWRQFVTCWVSKLAKIDPLECNCPVFPGRILGFSNVSSKWGTLLESILLRYLGKQWNMSMWSKPYSTQKPAQSVVASSCATTVSEFNLSDYSWRALDKEQSLVSSVDSYADLGNASMGLASIRNAWQNGP